MPKDRANFPALPGLGDDTAPRVRRMRRAADRTIRFLTTMGHLEPVDEIATAMLRTLADAWDAEVADADGSRYTEATLASRMLPVWLELRGERRDSASDVGYDEELEQLKAALRDAARSRPPDNRD